MAPSRRTRWLTIGGIVGLMLSGTSPRLVAAQASAASPSPSGYSKEVQSGVALLKKATAPFVTLDSAVAAGYAREVQRCYSDEHHGAMGFHHVNRAYVDAKIEIEKPEILLYERLPDGTYQLNGAEYIIPYRIWPRDSIPPKVFGLDMKQEDNLKLWYLHTWAYKENAAGLFADWNPAVKCPNS